MSHLNAQLLRDLVLERMSELVECPFVNRKIIAWPPEPLRMTVVVVIRSYLQIGFMKGEVTRNLGGKGLLL